MAINVAIVEDQKVTREGLKSMIESSDDLFCCGTFESGELFTSKFKHLQVDVVLMDIDLKNGISGIECVANLHDPKRNIQFLMCTNLEDSDNIFSALKVGATGYIVKNTTPDKMITAIKEIHSGGSPMSPHIARMVTLAFKQDKINSAQVESLTQLEKETLDMISKGYHYKEIAEKDEVSIHAIRERIRNIYEKLQVHNKTDAINKLYPRTKS
ncbi:MAG: response regulator transcription factor [Bacteroidota bacterium]